MSVSWFSDCLQNPPLPENVLKTLADLWSVVFILYEHVRETQKNQTHSCKISCALYSVHCTVRCITAWSILDRKPGPVCFNAHPSFYFPTSTSRSPPKKSPPPPPPFRWSTTHSSTSVTSNRIAKERASLAKLLKNNNLSSAASPLFFQATLKKKSPFQSKLPQFLARLSPRRLWVDCQ